MKGAAESHLDLRRLEQQVAERRVAGRGQHCVLNVGELEAQRAQLVGLGLAAGAFGLQEIPEGSGRSHDEVQEQQQEENNQLGLCPNLEHESLGVAI